MNRAGLIAWLIGLALLQPQASAATTTIGALKDNSLYESNWEFSGGGSIGVFVGTNNNGSTRRGLIGFDIAGNVPAGSTITGVELTLYIGNAPDEDYHDIELYRLNKHWGEGTAGIDHAVFMGSGMGFEAGAGDATWSDAEFGSAPWTTPGALDDIAATASATATVGGPIGSAHTWGSTARLVDDVQEWLDSPATNFGWALINTDEDVDRSLKAFYSREYAADTSMRPRLNITFTPGTEPTGDYNGNGFVDAADYVLWRKTLGQPASSPGSGADGNKTGTIDPGDYTYWRERFGNPVSGFATGATVPEPAGVTTCLFVAMLAFFRRRR